MEEESQHLLLGRFSGLQQSGRDFSSLSPAKGTAEGHNRIPNPAPRQLAYEVVYILQPT